MTGGGGKYVSKYEPLWQWISRTSGDTVMLTFSEIERILGFPVDHSFLNAKKELRDYEWQTGKISIKNETVTFERIGK